MLRAEDSKPAGPTRPQSNRSRTAYEDQWPGIAGPAEWGVALLAHAQRSTRSESAANRRCRAPSSKARAVIAFIAHCCTGARKLLGGRVSEDG